MDTYGPEERALFETQGTALYEEIAEAGGLPDADDRIQPGGELHEAFNLLVALSLIQHDRNTSRWVAEDPNSVHARVVSPLSHEAVKLLEASSQWARAFGVLSQSWKKAPSSSTGPFTYLHDYAIDPFLAALVADCEQEMLTAQPQTGRNLHLMPTGVLRDTALLERGAKIRTLYQHSARRNAITRKYVAAVTDRGAEVRTLDEFFNRIIVIDRRLAIIPGSGGPATALVIREPHLLAYLVDIFERTWERSRPFTNRGSAAQRDIAHEQRQMTIRMLIEGHSDPVSAKRLGVSARTFAGYVADLKEEYDSETRFQLGYTMGQAGVSGREDG